MVTEARDCKLCNKSLEFGNIVCQRCGLYNYYQPWKSNQKREELDFVMTLFDEKLFETKFINPKIKRAFDSTKDRHWWTIIFFNPTYLESSWYKELIAAFKWKPAK